LFVLTMVSPSFAQNPLELTVTAGKEDAKNIPVIVPLELSPKWAKVKHVKLNEVGTKNIIIGQLTAPGLLTEGVAANEKSLLRRDLIFVDPSQKGRENKVFTMEPSRSDNTVSNEYRWLESTAGQFTDLRHGDRPVLRYVHRPYDNSTEANRNKSYKVFHHLFDPTGTRLVTNGGESDPDSAGKKLLYPHHRGLMFAFNKITYGKGMSADTWHAKPKDTHQSHEGILSADAGLVFGRHRVAIDWHGPNKEVFAKEEREVTVYNVEGGTLLDFVTRLKSTGGKVRLDGDPQHAGFQFRASNEVAERTAKETYYLRPDGKGKPGETRNWDPKNKGPINLPWDAMSFVLDKDRFTVAYIDHPSNPGEKRYSERDYGRFGCYFEYDLTPENPLVLRYRFWLQNGEMTGEEVQSLRTKFILPQKFSVKEAASAK
jgi:hypothetical protein